MKHSANQVWSWTPVLNHLHPILLSSPNSMLTVLVLQHDNKPTRKTKANEC